MLFSQSNPPGGGALPPVARSESSIAFEEAWEFARGGERIPDRSAIDLKRFAKFARWFAIVEPDPGRISLPIRLAGSEFFDLFGADITGTDYLSLTDPAIREAAYESVMACLVQPCGLWQSTPTLVAGGGLVSCEYTILPIAKGGAAANHVAVYVNFGSRRDGPKPTVDRVEHATVWHWLDIGFGVPGPAF